MQKEWKTSESSRYNIQIISKTMKVLSTFDREYSEMTIGDISARAGIPKSTVHRIISSLIDWRMLEQAPNGKYRLGLKLFEFGSIVLSQMDVRKEVLPFLQALSAKIGETVHLSFRDGNQAIYIEKIEQPESLVRYSQVGKHSPLHCSAVGKVLLADLTPVSVRKLIGSSFEKHTRNTITELGDLLVHLRQIRLDGFSVDNEELVIGVKCVAAPIFNHHGEVIAAISISTLSNRLDDEVIQRFAMDLKDVAKQVSLRLGFSNNPQNQEWIHGFSVND